MAATIAVEVACPCPGTPHETDSVELREKLGLAAGATLQRLVLEANQDRPERAELIGRLAEAYLRVGVMAWSFVDAGGKPVPVTPDSIQSWLLDDFELSMPIADRADDLYLSSVLGPLVKKAVSSSPTTTTNGSTSASHGGSRTPRKRSKRSSTSTTPTAVTEATTR